ncbi:MAG: FeoA family protein [Chloroflexota bacterium]|nr:FeoA family protein [Chloroflexota bacterium]
MKGAAFPLSMAAVGEEVRLERIHGGEAVLKRLTALGLTPGVELSVVQDSGGPLLLSVRDSRIALGRGMAHRIMVSLKSDIDSSPSKIVAGRRARHGRFHRHPHRKNKFHK